MTRCSSSSFSARVAVASKARTKLPSAASSAQQLRQCCDDPDSFLNPGRRQCVDGRDLHEVLLQYAHDFFALYEQQAVPRMGLLNLMTAHEHFMHRLGILDEALPRFLERFERHLRDSTALFLLADHGTHGIWYNHFAVGQAEHRAPYLTLLLPAGFGAISTTFTMLLGYECTGSMDAAAATALFMAILPAHLMRSVAGGFDNESIAISAIVGTFFFWVRSLRTAYSWPWGLVCGIAYTYMVAAWGGYVFVVNMIGIHAGVLCLMGRFSSRLHHAYSLWYIVGTVGAVFGPARYLVGWQPFQSMEQLGPLAVFGGLQVRHHPPSPRLASPLLSPYRHDPNDSSRPFALPPSLLDPLGTADPAFNLPPERTLRTNLSACENQCLEKMIKIKKVLQSTTEYQEKK